MGVCKCQGKSLVHFLKDKHVIDYIHLFSPMTKTHFLCG